MALTDTVGELIRFVVPPSQSYDLTVIPELLRNLSCERLINDEAFDSDALLDTFAERGVEAVISPKTDRSIPRNFDRDTDRDQHWMANVFAKIKEFGAIAIRYHKTALSFVASIHMVAGVVAAR